MKKIRTKVKKNRSVATIATAKKKIEKRSRASRAEEALAAFLRQLEYEDGAHHRREDGLKNFRRFIEDVERDREERGDTSGGSLQW